MSMDYTMGWQQRVFTPVRALTSILSDRVQRDEFVFLLLRDIFRRLPLSQKARHDWRQFYMRHMATGARAIKTLPASSPEGWGNLTDGRWSRSHFQDAQGQLRAFSQVLRKENW